MTIQQLKYIMAVAKYRHFEKAADHCFVAQSTLSTMISKFEEEFDLSIFDRKYKPVRITKEGEVLIRQMKIILSEVDALEEMIFDLKDEVKGRLKVSCIPTIAPFLFPFFFPDFSCAYPGLSLELKESSTEEILNQLKMREIDVGIVSPPIEEMRDMISIPLYKESFVYFNTFELQKSSMPVQEIDFENFWVLEDGHCLTDQVMEICRRADKKINTPLNIKFKAGSIGSLIRFVKGNKGKTILPFTATKSLTEEEKRFITYFTDPMPQREVHFLTHKHFPKRKLMDLLTKEMKNKIRELKSGKHLKVI